MKKYIAFLGLVLLVACNVYKDLPTPPAALDWKTKKIPPSPQVAAGDPEKGLDYIINGDYIGSGIPYEMIRKPMTKRGDTVLNRTGLNKDALFILTAFEAQNGVAVANGNCFTCHAGELNGKIVLGLGDSFSDFTNNLKPLAKGMKLAMKLKYGKKSEEWTAFEDFYNYFSNSAPYVKASQRGVNSAANLAEACVAYRDPITLEFTDEPILELPNYVLASDVPPLWNVKKKNALYYTAVGRGDFTKLLFQASVLGIADSSAARKAVTNFKDVVAWLKQLEAPKYPGEIDKNLASKGELIFQEHCQGCHGTYGEEETYPNKVVSLKVIKTDPYYATYAVNAPIVDWYNKSWFALTEPRSHFEPEAGYIAPPLDGVWATAPYLHNGSVPTLDDLLNSKSRPTYWKRSGDSRDYDFNKIGWNYESKKGSAGKWTYDTTIPGYGNMGHYFGDKLKDQQRKSVIEYLKTL
ncbi:MAG: hypothetical protein AAF242_17150 [Bacteroidota bacterium]